MLVLVLCFGLILSGCPKKTVMKDEPTVKKSEDAARLEAERAAKEQAAENRRRERAREREAARIKEEEARRPKRKSLKRAWWRRNSPASRERSLKANSSKISISILINMTFDPRMCQVLKENAALLMKYPSVKIQIEGHCDERGTAEYNLALGERRANSAKKYLVSLGVPADRLSTISYGKEMPLDPDIMRRHGPKIEGPTLSSFRNKKRDTLML